MRYESMLNLLHALMIPRSNSMARIHDVEYSNRVSECIFEAFHFVSIDFEGAIANWDNHSVSV